MMNYINRVVTFLFLARVISVAIFFSFFVISTISCQQQNTQPNIIYIFGDQWRWCDTGYAGNDQVKTPHIDKLASESFNFTNAISGVPVCSPYRASLLTGQRWQTHGIFHNDKLLNPEANTIGKVYKKAGYKTGYIGKWHLNGTPKGESIDVHRKLPIPKENRQGFDFWRVLECTHDYNNSLYFDENNNEHTWEGYDAYSQTQVAKQYIKDNAGSPFILFLSWGPPHNPYATAPEKYKRMYDPEKIVLRPNVPDDRKEIARREIAGYYAHISALDDYIGELQQSVLDAGVEENTIFVFTSDHGDMLHSQSMREKQVPWDESIRVPFLLKYPAISGKNGRTIDAPFDAPDVMPTLLGLSNLPIPESVEGTDFSGVIKDDQKPVNEAVVIATPVPFGGWTYKRGGREFRGVRTRQYTYCRDLNGPWLLYDNNKDPYQMNNLVNKPEVAILQKELDNLLNKMLEEQKDQFLTGQEYMDLWDYDWHGNEGQKPEKEL